MTGANKYSTYTGESSGTEQNDIKLPWSTITFILYHNKFFFIFILAGRTRL